MQIDFSQFPEEILNSSEQDLQNTINKLNEKLTEIQEQFEAVENPNLKVYITLLTQVYNMLSNYLIFLNKHINQYIGARQNGFVGAKTERANHGTT